MIRNKSGQEEMVGFAVIMILVAVIFLIFLGFSLRSNLADNVESYEVESFLQGVLQYTSDCEIVGRGYRSVQDLVYNCHLEKVCLDGTPACEVLEPALINLVESSWKAGEEFPVKRYELIINVDGFEEPIIIVEKGDATNNYKGDSQMLSKAGLENIEVIFTAYY